MTEMNSFTDFMIYIVGVILVMEISIYLYNRLKAKIIKKFNIKVRSFDSSPKSIFE